MTMGVPGIEFEHGFELPPETLIGQFVIPSDTDER